MDSKKKDSRGKTRLEKILDGWDDELLAKGGVSLTNDPRLDMEIALMTYAREVAKHPALYYYSELVIRRVSLMEALRGFGRVAAEPDALSRMVQLVDALYPEDVHDVFKTNPYLEVNKKYRERFTVPVMGTVEEVREWSRVRDDWDRRLKEDLKNYPDLTKEKLEEIEDEAVRLENLRNGVFITVKLIHDLKAGGDKSEAERQRIDELYLKLLWMWSSFQADLNMIESSTKPVELFSATRDLSQSKNFSKHTLKELPALLFKRFRDYGKQYWQLEEREYEKGSDLPPVELHLGRRGSLPKEDPVSRLEELPGADDDANPAFDSGEKQPDKLDEKFSDERWHNILKSIQPPLTKEDFDLIERIVSGDKTTKTPAERARKARLMKKLRIAFAKP